MEEINKNNSSMPAASLTLGIVSIVLSVFWYITIPTGILAIIFGKKTTNRFGSKLGKAGLITGIVGLSLFAFLYVRLAIKLIME